ncbi:MAG: hypothetical protein ACI9E1_002006 [Cryomorphaceae bacterium]
MIRGYSLLWSTNIERFVYVLLNFINQYMYINKLFLTAITGLSFSPSPASATLTINLDFTNFSSGAPSDGDAILGGANLSDAQAVIQKAASYWESVFENSSSSIGWTTNNSGNLTQNITVGWGGQAGDTLASGGTSWFTGGGNGRWSSGTLTWDNDGTSKFYVDTDTTNSSEWRQSSSRDMPFNGVVMNAERVHFDAPAGIIRDNSDMMTVAIHEIGHALGFLGSFPAYAASDIDSDGDIDITSGAYNGAQLAIDGGHTDFQIETPPGGDYPYDLGGGSSWVPGNIYPNVMGPSITTGTRKLLTEADIAIVAEFLQFDMDTVNFNPSLVPEPSSTLLLGLGSLALFVRRRR